MERMRDYEPKAFFAQASDAGGQPRLTIDVDIVVDMKWQRVEPFVVAFPIPDYYASKEGIRDSLQRRYPFNVIEPRTGAKVDLVPLPRDPGRLRLLQLVIGHVVLLTSDLLDTPELPPDGARRLSLSPAQRSDPETTGPNLSTGVLEGAGHSL